MLAVLLVGGLASAGMSLALQRNQQRLATQLMDRAADQLGGIVDDEASHYRDVLADLTAAIGTQPVLTRAVFDGMTANLNPARLPGVTGVTFVVPALDGQLPGVQAAWRARGAIGLTLKSAGTGIDHQFVVFGRSFVGAAPVLGRDLSVSPETSDALRIARETGEFTISKAHVLLRDRTLPRERQQMSFTLAMSVFGRPDAAGARPLRGWVAMGVRGGDFLGETLRIESRGTMQARLSDPAGGSEAVIAAFAGGTRMAVPSLYRERTIVVGQRAWHMSLWPTTALLSASDRWGGRLALLAGLSITALLATLVGVLAFGRNRAMNDVDNATAALREDIRRREAVERELHRLAFHDQLTGLANRGLFYDRVGQALHTHARSGESFAVFFLDLDGFKQVNDEYGHSAGDVVLREVAERLRACLRDGDTVARFGGDEFAVIVEHLADPGDVHRTADRIVTAVRHPINLGPREALVTASVGIALNRPGDTADDILREADVAMYTAKTTGKSRHVLAAR